MLETGIEKQMSKISKGYTFLATVGSTAPFIGLFGKVGDAVKKGMERHNKARAAGKEPEKRVKRRGFTIYNSSGGCCEYTDRIKIRQCNNCYRFVT